MEKLQDLSQPELQDLLDNSERVESMALESDEVRRLWSFVRDSSPNNENSVIIYSPSYCSKLISMSFFCGTQKEMLGKMCKVLEVL